MERLHSIIFLNVFFNALLHVSGHVPPGPWILLSCSSQFV